MSFYRRLIFNPGIIQIKLPEFLPFTFYFDRLNFLS